MKGCDALGIDPANVLWEVGLGPVCGPHGAVSAAVLEHPGLVRAILCAEIVPAGIAVALCAALTELSGMDACVATIQLGGLRGLLHPEEADARSDARGRYAAAAAATEAVMNAALGAEGLAMYRVLYLGMGRIDLVVTPREAETVGLAAAARMRGTAITTTVQTTSPVSTAAAWREGLSRDPRSAEAFARKEADRAGFPPAPKGRADVETDGPAQWLSPSPDEPVTRKRGGDALFRGRLDIVDCSTFLRRGGQGLLSLQTRGALLSALFRLLVPRVVADRPGPHILFSSTDDLILEGPEGAVANRLAVVADLAQAVFGLASRTALVPIVPSSPAETARRLARRLSEQRSTAVPVRLPPPAPVGLITSDERALLYELGSRLAPEAGDYVDAGSFLGASALAMALGLRAASDDRRARIHCFDTFAAPFPETYDLIARKSGIRLETGSSFAPLFAAQTREIRDVLAVHQSDLLARRDFRHPVALLLLDICKSRKLHSACADLFLRRLIPGTGVLVHQDYHHPHLPYIHVCTEFLADRFEILSPRVGESIVLRLSSAIPERDLARVIRYDFTDAEQLCLMDRAVARLPDVDTFEMRLARLVLRRRVHGQDCFRREVDGLRDQPATPRQKVYLKRIVVYAETGRSPYSGW
ncbi:hypothetical protein [Rhodophyticola sp.]|jgi:hypothetical protein|uniref:hypothetical protein n=1 Tax=Rhodophyticola sp. TaxID=2680032 RepID=UPI003D2AACD6